LRDVIFSHCEELFLPQSSMKTLVAKLSLHE
jgi:hypothetical protein